MAPVLHLPAMVTMTFGAQPAFQSCLAISDDTRRAEVRRAALMTVPMIVGLALAVELHRMRLVELLLLVLVLAFQFYSAHLGDAAHDASMGLFATFLAGLLLPLPTKVVPEMALMVLVSTAATTLLRAIVLPPDAQRSLRVARKGLLVRQMEVLDATIAYVGSGDRAPATRIAQRERRLRRRVSALQTAALQADSLIAREGSGAPGAVGRALHSLLFDSELSVELLARRAPDLARLPKDLRAEVLRALDELRAGTPETARPAAAYLRAAAARTANRNADPVRQVAAILEWIADLGGRDRVMRSTLPGRSDIAFTSSVGLTRKGAVKGSASVMESALAQGALIGPWRRFTMSSHARTTIQGVIAIAVVEPLGLLLSDQRFYWGVIGVMVVLLGTATVHERVIKTGRRLLGTVLGAAIGLPLAYLFQGDGLANCIIIVAALAIGAYSISTHYEIWTTGLVTALCQLYSSAGSLTQWLLPLRLAENGMGAVVACLVSAIVLPIGSTRVLRTQLVQVLCSLRAFALTAGVAAPADLRGAARAVQFEVYRLNDVSGHHRTFVSARADADNLLLSRVQSLALLADRLAAQPSLPEGADAVVLHRAALRVARAVDRVTAALTGAEPRAEDGAEPIRYRNRVPELERRLVLMSRMDATLGEFAELIRERSDSRMAVSQERPARQPETERRVTDRVPQFLHN